VTQISATAPLRDTSGAAPAAAQAKQPSQQPAPAPQQQSAEVTAKIEAIYAEAEQEHWTEAQTNQAVTKELEESGSSSASAAALIDTTA
jgi:hypothetical protein